MVANEKTADRVIGKWRMYETVDFQNNDDSAAVKCNVCPEVEFSKNYTGFIKSADAGLFYFKWKIDNDALVIHQNKNGQTNDIMNDGNYKLTLFDNIPIKEMSLTDTVRNIKYILSK
ncbi:hypothetical protein JN11_03729 [Mucilaginibacter frigoritolerans]|uniref:Lipocalin-like protein n=2 Tax=Mucilaginibacter frigoritolerans TaxID=652788 RepID=A0A562TVG6_9SPHI|nr:hypothetical protein JN11_03729 [Mucilaginibacter frigoritolerans]